VKAGLTLLIAGLATASLQLGLTQTATAQSTNMTVPKSVEAGAAFSIQTTGSGKATLLIVGPSQLLRHDVQLGESIYFAAGLLYNAGRYVAVLETGASPESEIFDVLPANKPAELSFLARPSRLPVGLHNGITGAVYVFDAYNNLITAPAPVSFQLSSTSGTAQKHVVQTRDGAAWTAMDSTGQQGMDKFVAQLGDISSARIVAQVPGDPCALKMSAKQSGQQLQLSTDPVRDCNGNAVPDGTIVTFTETYRGAQAAVDVPLKRGIAEVEMPIHNGATISVASGVVMGNQIGWGK
jgi:hypothetical protein